MYELIPQTKRRSKSEKEQIELSGFTLQQPIRILIQIHFNSHEWVEHELQLSKNSKRRAMCEENKLISRERWLC